MSRVFQQPWVASEARTVLERASEVGHGRAYCDGTIPRISGGQRGGGDRGDRRAGFENGRVCSNGQTFRREIMEFKLLAAIRDELLSDVSVERFKAKRLRRFPGAPGRRRRAYRRTITE